MPDLHLVKREDNIMKTLRVFCVTLLLVAFSTVTWAGDQQTSVPSDLTSSHFFAERVVNSSIPSSRDGIDEDSTIFFEDFEVEPTDWETVDLTDIGPQWHPDTFNAYNGNSWWCGDSFFGGYFNLWLQYLDTPTLDLSLSANPQLTFKVRWAMESTSGFPPPAPYDGWDGCNVWISTDSGTNWEVIEPVSPAYTSTNLSGFGTVWGFGPGIPGWADSSGGWLDATFDLSGYTSRWVKLRWALCSDRAVSSQGHPEITGFFVDDLLLMDASDTLLWNDADGAEYPAPLTFEVGPPFGDWWEWTTDDAHSPTHSMRVDDDHFYINNALVSPPIDVPEGYTTKFKYWVHCDFPDSTHPGSESLRDYYFVEASADGGVIWDTLFYDYARGGAGYPDWAQMVPGLPYNGNMDMDLTLYAGETIQLRFRAITDGDHVSGNGEGLFIDDVEVYVNDLPTDDVGIKSFYLPFPTVVHNLIEGEVTVRNYGLNEQLSFYAFWRIDGQPFPVGATPLWSLPGQTEETETISFTPEFSGPLFIDAYTSLMGDVNPANDTSWAGLVEIFPIGEWMSEMGYDARGYSYLVDLLSLTYYQDNGPLMYVEQAGYGGWSWVRFFVLEPGDLTLHILDTGTPTQPGTELGAIPLTIATNEVYPQWKVVNISSISEMGYRMPGQHFWIWLEMTQSAGGPALLADYIQFGQEHLFDFNGGAPSASQYECYIRALKNDNIGVEPEYPASIPFIFKLESPHPNPFNPSTRIAFTLPSETDVSLQAFNLTGRMVAEIVSGTFNAGRHEVVWDAGKLSSGIYLVRLEAEWGAQIQKALLVK